MAKTPPAPSEAAAALATGAQNNAAKYVSRATGAASRWATEVANAGPAWQGGVTAPGTQQRYLKNTREAGAGGYSTGITEKGTNRYAPGVTTGQAKYAKNVAPYFQVIASTPLPARGLRGAGGNYARVQALGNALHARRAGVAAAGG